MGTIRSGSFLLLCGLSPVAALDAEREPERIKIGWYHAAASSKSRNAIDCW
jgi:hypothetical protein